MLAILAELEMLPIMMCVNRRRQMNTNKISWLTKVFYRKIMIGALDNQLQLYKTDLLLRVVWHNGHRKVKHRREDRDIGFAVWNNGMESYCPQQPLSLSFSLNEYNNIKFGIKKRALVCIMSKFNRPFLFYYLYL